MAHERFYGVGEPLVQREEDTKIPAWAYLDLIKGMGCNDYRSWMYITDILLDPLRRSVLSDTFKYKKIKGIPQFS